MGSYSGGSYFWNTIEDILDGTTLTHSALYKRGLRRLKDSLGAVRDLTNALRVDLGQTHTVLPAVIRSPNYLSDVLFYDPVDTPVGDLDGKTLIITTDLAGPVTITFATPANPANACAQINAQGASLGITAEVDDGIDPATGTNIPGNAGKLRLKRYGAGSPSITIDKLGTANTTLGFSVASNTTATGTASTALDGASRIGLSAISSVAYAGGNVRDFIENTLAPLISSILLSVDNMAASDGGTLSSSDQTITSGMLTSNNTHFVAPAPSADRTYTLPAGVNGQTVTIRANPNPPNNIFVARPDTTLIAKLSGTIGATTVQQYVQLTKLSGAWYVTGFGNSDDNQTLT